MKSFAIVGGCGLALMSLVGLLGGCSSRSDVETAKAGGVVTLKGQPMKDVGVVFHPTSGPIASGMSDSEGKFRLSTLAPNDGAVVGDHKVSLAYSDPNAKPDDPPAKSPIPERYASPETSGITAKVEAGKENFFEFDLTE